MISLLFWAIIPVVGIKYLLFVMRADNNGEGGVPALMALSLQAARFLEAARGALMALGIFGACMFYGDAVITPAISVMSAVEGLEIATPHPSHLVLPITIVILIALFWIQRHGTALVGKLFGPIMVLWFVVIAALGVPHRARAGHHGRHQPVLRGVVHGRSPAAGVRRARLGRAGATGAEALYADMGHFGAKPIRIAAYAAGDAVARAELLRRRALLIQNPKAIENPFFPAGTRMGLLPLVAVDGRDRDRVAGGDLGCVFADVAGHPARLRAAHEGAAHVGTRDRPDLRAGRELLLRS